MPLPVFLLVLLLLLLFLLLFLLVFLEIRPTILGSYTQIDDSVERSGQTRRQNQRNLRTIVRGRIALVESETSERGFLVSSRWPALPFGVGASVRETRRFSKNVRPFLRADLGKSRKSGEREADVECKLCLEFVVRRVE